MQLVHAIFFGIGMLILAFLVFTNGKAVSDIIGSGTSNVASVASVLQGR